MSAAHLPKNIMISSRTMAWMMPATGVCAPFLMFVAVRAMAPVAGMPPKSGEAMFATPWATSSMFERCLRPVIPSATTAERSDSMPASSAMEMAGETICGSLLQSIWGRCSVGGVLETAPNLLPIVSTGRLNRGTRAVVAMMATSEPGTRLVTRGQKTTIRRVRMPISGSGRSDGACMLCVFLDLVHELRRDLFHVKAEEVPDLSHRDDERDAGGEPDGYRVRNVLDHTAQLDQAHDHEQDAGHDRGDHQAVVAVFLDDAVDDDDESAGRAADLDAAAAQDRDEEPGDDGGIKPLLRLDAGCDGKGDRERQGHDADDDPGGQVLEEDPAGVPFPDNGQQFRFEF